MTKLEHYLRDFDPQRIVINMGNLAEAYHIRSAHMSKFNERQLRLTKTRKIDQSHPTPVFNTCTGEQVYVPSNKIIEESVHNAAYIMQDMRMGDFEVKIFFDQGADHHLIDGELAEHLKLKVLCKTPTNIGLAGGGSVSTEFGSYALSIGPDPDGNYYKISSQGITTVTNEFPEVNL